jgi:hypothetical protein
MLGMDLLAAYEVARAMVISQETGGQESAKNGWFHLFKHPWHPATRQPQSLLIPARVESEATPEVAPEEKEKVRFTLDLEPELHQRLSEAAERMGRHKSDLVRWAFAKRLLRSIVQLLKDLRDDALLG